MPEPKLLMISGDRVLAQGKMGAFYNTLEEFHKYWERIDIIVPKARGPAPPHPHSAQSVDLRAMGGPQSGHPFASFDNVFVHSSPWPLIFQPFWILKKGREIYREQRFDLMTVHEYPPFYNGIGAKMLWSKIKVPYILDIFHIIGYPKTADLKEKIYKWLFYLFIKYDCRKAKAIRVMNNQVKTKLIDLGVPDSKINLIPAIYIDLDIFKPINQPAGGEKKYDLIFVGRLVRNKGVDLFLEAVRKLNCRALIVGDGPLKNWIKSKVKNWKLEIGLYGWAKDSQEIAELLNQSKILILSSYNEGGPRVVLEAMACGTPVIATKVGIIPDIILSGQSGFLADWSGKSISEKAQILLDNQEFQNRFSSAGLKIVEKFEKRSAIRNYAEKLQFFIK